MSRTVKSKVKIWLAAGVAAYHKFIHTYEVVLCNLRLTIKERKFAQVLSHKNKDLKLRPLDVS